MDNLPLMTIFVLYIIFKILSIIIPEIILTFLFIHFISNNKLYNLILLFIFILLNYFLLRIFIIHCIYQWQIPNQRINIYNERLIYIKNIRELYKNFKKSLKSLQKYNNNKIYNEIIDIKKGCFLVNYQYKIFKQVNEKYHKNISYYIKKYYEAIYVLYKELKKDDFLKYFLNLKENDIYDGMNIDWDNDLNREIINPYYTIKFKIIKIHLKRILKYIDEYLCEKKSFFNPFFIYNFITNDLFSNLYLKHIEFLNLFENYHIEDQIINNISTCLISNKITKNKTLFIKCGPNGGIYEDECIEKKLNFYMSHNIDLFLWNYRGYGLSKGKSSFTNAKNDVLMIYDYIKKNYNYNKICVVGYSIGGVAAIYLAKKRKIDLLVSDRNFISIVDILLNFHCGKIYKFFFKLFFIGNNYTLNDFLRANCKKILIYSPKDKIIQIHSSLKTGVAKAILKNSVYIKKNNNFIVHDNALDLLLENENREINKSNFINLFLFLFNKYNMIKLTNLSFNLSENESIICESLSKEIKNYDSIKEEINLSLYKFFDIFVGITADNINDLKKIESLRIKKLFIDDFFTNILIWGIQYYRYVSKNNKFDYKFYNYKIKELFVNLKNILNNIVNANIDQKKYSIVKDIIKLNNFFEIFIQNLNKLKINNIITNEINKNKKISNNCSNENFLTKLIDGNNNKNDLNFKDEFEIFCNDFEYLIKNNIKLIKISCGHNGIMTEDEIELYEEFLREFNFI